MKRSYALREILQRQKHRSVKEARSEELVREIQALNLPEPCPQDLVGLRSVMHRDVVVSKEPFSLLSVQELLTGQMMAVKVEEVADVTAQGLANNLWGGAAGKGL